MFGRMGNRLLQFHTPCRFGLVGAGIDQIERIAVEHGSRFGHRIKGFGHRMFASQGLQIGIVERLHADRQAIDTGGAVIGQTARLDTGRIGLHRHFDIAGHRPMAADRIQQSSDGFRRHQRGRAAAQKNTGDDPVGHQLRLLRYRPRKA